MAEEAPRVTDHGLNLNGQGALVTGGARGIGRAITLALLAAGARVVICGRNAPESLPTAGGRSAEFLPCDIRDAAQAQAMVAQAAEQMGRLDIVINNAGGSPEAPSDTASPRLFERVVALNLLAPFYIAQAANKVMQGQELGGQIINIASVSGVRPSPGAAAYGAGKAGLLNLTQTLAMEWGPKVRLNALIVGLVDSGSGDDYYGEEGGAGRAAIAARIPLRRMATPDDVAKAVMLLASPLAGYVSGAQLAVTGGGEPPGYIDLAKP
jgi:NAD(P)-dependent dehydrogenase (short-subunit alcohol dehydrogenase family)